MDTKKSKSICDDYEEFLRWKDDLEGTTWRKEVDGTNWRREIENGTYNRRPNKRV